ncbi:STAS domain-containing protein [Sulfitobacter sp. JB4-11]|uniref:STAS domain-containing protein n=1 Tax=Sulfitobacter rhodophyticola TaxID=3238304 RepID=UPI003D81AE0E
MADVLTPKGKLDLAAATDLRTALMAQPDGDITLDLGQVTQIGALCMQVCVAAGKSLRAKGHYLQIINTPDPVMAHLQAMGMTPETLAEGAP